MQMCVKSDFFVSSLQYDIYLITFIIYLNFVPESLPITLLKTFFISANNFNYKNLKEFNVSSGNFSAPIQSNLVYEQKKVFFTTINFYI